MESFSNAVSFSPFGIRYRVDNMNPVLDIYAQFDNIPSYKQLIDSKAFYLFIGTDLMSA